MDSLSRMLYELGQSDYYPFHMPGHKRNAVTGELQNPYLVDITEIDGFDNLHEPRGILLQEQRLTAEMFGSEDAFWLVNGSTCGIETAMMAVGGSVILMGRNAHKSAYSGIYLAGTKVDYLYPQKVPGLSCAGEVLPCHVEEMLKRGEENGRNYAAVFLTSPTYEGFVSDVGAICEIAHARGIPVIVDEAHGAHLGLWGGDGYFPESALKQGADIVIESLHKTLPAMTQTAVLLAQGELVDRSRIRTCLSMLQSSSPSYVLMGSISACLRFCRDKGDVLPGEYKEKLQNFYEKTKDLKRLAVIGEVWEEEAGRGDFEAVREKEAFRERRMKKDPGKILIKTGESGLGGAELYRILRERYHLQPEMAARDYVTAMTSVMDSSAGLDRLAQALTEIDRAQSGIPPKRAENTSLDAGIEKKSAESGAEKEDTAQRASAVCTIKQAVDAPKVRVRLAESAGCVSGEFVCLYPPGIPLIVPGERITEDSIAVLQKAEGEGLAVQGMRDPEGVYIDCLRENAQT